MSSVKALPMSEKSGTFQPLAVVFISCFQQSACRVTNVGLLSFGSRRVSRLKSAIPNNLKQPFLVMSLGRRLHMPQDRRKHRQLRWKELQPVAVVMDLAKGYHTFINEIYPSAIRIADCFHVNRYVTEALQVVRKQVQKELLPRARQQLKRHFRLLGKRADQLTDKETELINQFLQYSDVLRAVYEWKEAFITWYDCSSNHTLAVKGFVRWIKQGEQINSSAVQSCLKTMKNWQEEICNYHHLRFTNAAVEGRNNKIKALQRRHYFIRNPQHYKQRILLECNEELIGW